MLRFPTGATDFYFLEGVKTGFELLIASYLLGTGAHFRKVINLILKLISLLFLVPTLRRSGAISPVPSTPHGVQRDNFTVLIFTLML